jgi:hypothetical protein
MVAKVMEVGRGEGGGSNGEIIISFVMLDGGLT